MWVCAHGCRTLLRTELSESLKQELQAILSHPWVLGTELATFAGTVHTQYLSHVPTPCLLLSNIPFLCLLPPCGLWPLRIL